jgi:hypothetical protein
MGTGERAADTTRGGQGGDSVLVEVVERQAVQLLRGGVPCLERPIGIRPD